MSNSITCNLTITAFYLISFFVYLLSLSICLLLSFVYLLFVSAFISLSFLYEFYFLFSFSFSFMFYLFFISFLSLFISFLSLFYFFFISFLFLSARRIFVHNYFLFLLYGDAPLVLQVTASTQAPIIFIFKSSTIGMVPFAEHCNVTDTYFSLNKASFFLD